MFRFVTALVLLAGCPSPSDPSKGDPDPVTTPAAFADATGDQRAAALQTALGFGGVMGLFAQMQADADARSVDDDNQPSGCPAYAVLSEAPLTVRYTAESCVGPSGVRWDGALEAVNPLSFADFDGEEGGLSLTFEDFSLDDGAFVQRFDGTFAQTDVRMGVDATATYDLVADLGGEVWTLSGGSAITWEGETQRVVCDAGTVGEVSDLGGFDVACDVVAFGEMDGSGTVTLVGADTLVVTMTPDVDGCFPAAVDGVAVEPICLEGSGGGGGGGALDNTVFGGTGLGCSDTDLFVDAQTLAGEVARVELRLDLPGAAPDEAHTVPAGESSVEEYDFFQGQLALGTYTPGEASALDCTTLDAVNVAFVAYDAADEVVGCQLAGFGGEEGALDLSDCPRL